MKSLSILWLALALVSLAGCNNGGTPMPMALVGNYKVMIAANGKMDVDTMSVTLGADNGVLLNFVYGISEVRCGVTGSTGLTIPRQVLHVSHSTGTYDGTGSGMGTIAQDGTVDITIDLSTPGFDPPDGSASDGGTAVAYAISGTRE